LVKEKPFANALLGGKNGIGLWDKGRRENVYEDHLSRSGGGEDLRNHCGIFLSFNPNKRSVGGGGGEKGMGGKEGGRNSSPAWKEVGCPADVRKRGGEKDQHLVGLKG